AAAGDGGQEVNALEHAAIGQNLNHAEAEGGRADAAAGERKPDRIHADGGSAAAFAPALGDLARLRQIDVVDGLTVGYQPPGREAERNIRETAVHLFFRHRPRA